MSHVPETGNSEDQHWPKIPLRHVCQLNPSVPFNELDDDKELTFLSMDKVKSGFFIPNTEKFSKYNSSYNAFEEGDIVLAKVTPCFENGNIAIAENLVGGKGFGSSELFVIRPKKVELKFLFYYFQSSAFKQEGEASMTGAGGLKRVSADLLRQHYLPYPSHEIQCLIVDFLNRETGHIDALVSEKETMFALLEEKSIALVSRAVTRGLDPNAPLRKSTYDWLGKIPAHWETWRLKYLAEVRGGLTLGKKYQRNDLVEVAYLRVANVQDGFLALEDVKTVEVTPEEAENYLLQNEDVLMNEGGDIDKLGRGCVWREEITPCLHQNHVFAVRPESIDPEWLALWTSTLQAKRYFELRAKRSTNLASISGTSINELPVPIPPREERNEIRNYIEASTGKIQSLKRKTQKSIDLLKERRSALINAAVTNQISAEKMRR